MNTERIEGLWLSAMNVASAMKKDGIDTSEAVKKLRDAKVLLNHVIHDEHAHGEELFEAELAIEGVHGYLAVLLKELGRENDFSFEVKPKKKSTKPHQEIPINIPRNKSWVRINIPEGINGEELASSEGLKIIAREGNQFTLAGDKVSIKKALQKVSEVYSR